MPGVIAGMAMATWAMAVAAFTTAIWAPPQGVAQTLGFGHPGHDFQPGPVLLGVLIHTINSAAIGAVFVAVVRRLRLTGRAVITAAGAAYGVTVYGAMSPVVLRGLLGSTSGSFLTAIPEWAWAVGHVLFGVTLGVTTALFVERSSDARQALAQGPAFGRL